MEASDRDPVDERRVQDEERAAAEEAGDIGGRAGDEDLDPAERPVVEGGGGVAEGFEQAEEQLIENAGHGEGNPAADAFPPEPEQDHAAHGEADEVESATTEGTEDRPDRWEGGQA